MSTTHRQGCGVFGDYVHGVGPCTCGAVEAVPAARDIATEDGIRWQAGAWSVERKAVTVDGHTWYRHDHERVRAQAAPAGDAPKGEGAVPVAVRWERRRGYGKGSGNDAYDWTAWKPCTEAEARRVTGLRSWQVRRLDCFATVAAQAVPAGQPQPVLYWVEADENRMLDGLYIEPDQANEYRSNGRTLIPLYASPPAGTAAPLQALRELVEAEDFCKQEAAALLARMKPGGLVTHTLPSPGTLRRDAAWAAARALLGNKEGA